MRTKIPQLKVTASKKDDAKKKGLAGALTGVGSMVSGVGSSGASAAGGLFGSLSSGLNVLLATKAGIVGLAALGTAGALGIGVMATRHAGTPAESAPLTSEFFQSNGPKDGPAPAAKQSLETSRADSTQLMAEAAKNEAASFSGEQPKPAEAAKDAAVKTAATRASAAPIPAGGSGAPRPMPAADPFAGHRLSDGGGLAGGVGQKFASLGGGGGGAQGVTPGAGSPQPGGIQLAANKGSVEGMTKVQAARANTLTARRAGANTTKNALMLAYNSSRAAAAASNAEAAHYAAGAAFDANGAKPSSIGGPGLSGGPTASGADTGASPTGAPGTQITPPTPPVASNTKSDLDNLLHDLMMELMVLMAAASVAAMIAQQLNNSGGFWNALGKAMVYGSATTALVGVTAFMLPNIVKLSKYEGQGMMVAMYSLMAVAISVTAGAALMGAGKNTDGKTIHDPNADKAAGDLKNQARLENEKTLEPENADEEMKGADDEGAGSSSGPKSADAPANSGNASPDVSTKVQPPQNAGGAPAAQQYGNSNPMSSQPTDSMDSVQQKFDTAQSDPNMRVSDHGDYVNVTTKGSNTGLDTYIKDSEGNVSQVEHYPGSTDAAGKFHYNDGTGWVKTDNGLELKSMTASDDGMHIESSETVAKYDKAGNFVSGQKVLGDHIDFAPPNPSAPSAPGQTYSSIEPGTPQAALKPIDAGNSFNVQSAGPANPTSAAASTGGTGPLGVNTDLTGGGQSAQAGGPRLGVNTDLGASKSPDELGVSSQPQTSGQQQGAAPQQNSGGNDSGKGGNGLQAVGDMTKSLGGMAQGMAGQGGGAGANGAQAAAPHAAPPPTAPATPAHSPTLDKLAGAGADKGGGDAAPDAAPADGADSASSHVSGPAPAQLPTAGGDSLVQGAGGGGEASSSLVQGSGPAPSFAAPHSAAPGSSLPGVEQGSSGHFFKRTDMGNGLFAYRQVDQNGNMLSNVPTYRPGEVPEELAGKAG